MSNTYQLTQEIHNLINQINQETGKELRVESHFGILNNGTVVVSQYSRPVFNDFLVAFNHENIQRLLCELDLGRNIELTKKCDEEIEDRNDYDIVCLFVELLPNTQAKALSDKWFSLQETDGKATPSLWNSGEEGQIEVLTELKEVLENYLNN